MKACSGLSCWRCHVSPSPLFLCKVFHIKGLALDLFGDGLVKYSFYGLVKGYPCKVFIPKGKAPALFRGLSLAVLIVAGWVKLTRQV
jgi:hypothetical protein